MVKFDIRHFFTDSLEEDVEKLKSATFQDYLRMTGQRDILDEVKAAISSSGYQRLRAVDRIRAYFHQPLSVNFIVNSGNPNRALKVVESGSTDSFHVAKGGDYHFTFTSNFLHIEHDAFLDSIEVVQLSETELDISYRVNSRLKLRKGVTYYSYLMINTGIRRQCLEIALRCSYSDSSQNTLPFQSAYELQVFYETWRGAANVLLKTPAFAEWLRREGVPEEFARYVEVSPVSDKAALLLYLIGFVQYAPRGGVVRTQQARRELMYAEVVRADSSQLILTGLLNAYCARTLAQPTGTFIDAWGTCHSIRSMRQGRATQEGLSYPARQEKGEAAPNDGNLQYELGQLAFRLLVTGLPSPEACDPAEHFKRAFLLLPQGALREKALLFLLISCALRANRSRTEFVRDLLKLAFSEFGLFPSMLNRTVRTVFLRCLSCAAFGLIRTNEQGMSIEEYLLYGLLHCDLIDQIDYEDFGTHVDHLQCEDACFLSLVAELDIPEASREGLLAGMIEDNPTRVVRSLMHLGEGPAAILLASIDATLGRSGKSLLLRLLADGGFQPDMRELEFLYTLYGGVEPVIPTLSRRLTGEMEVLPGNLCLLDEVLLNYEPGAHETLANAYLDFLSVHEIDLDERKAAVLDTLVRLGTEPVRLKAEVLLASRSGALVESYPTYVPVARLALERQALAEACAGGASDEAALLRALWLDNVYLLRIGFLDVAERERPATTIRFVFREYPGGRLEPQTYVANRNNFYFLPERPTCVFVPGMNLLLRCPEQGDDSNRQITLLRQYDPSVAEMRNWTLPQLKNLLEKSFWEHHRLPSPLRFLLLVKLNNNVEFAPLNKTEKRRFASLFLQYSIDVNDWVLLNLLQCFLGYLTDKEMREKLSEAIGKIDSSGMPQGDNVSQLNVDQIAALNEISSLLSTVDDLDGNDDKSADIVQRLLQEKTCLFSQSALSFCVRMLKKNSVHELIYIDYLEKYFENLLESMDAEDSVFLKVIARSLSHNEMTIRYKMAARCFDTQFVIALTNYYLNEAGGKLDDFLASAVKMLLHGQLPCSPTKTFSEIICKMSQRYPDLVPLDEFCMRNRINLAREAI